MDHGACNVIYVDKRAQEEVIRRDALASSKAAQAGASKTAPGYFDALASHSEDIYSSLEALLTVFEEGELSALCSQQFSAFTMEHVLIFVYC